MCVRACMCVCVCVCVYVWSWGGGGSLVGLSPWPMGSDTISKQMVSEFHWMAGHPAGVPENYPRTYMLSHSVVPTLCGPMDCSLQGSSVHGFSKQEYWSGSPCPPSGDLPNPGIEPRSPEALTLQVDSLLLSHWGSPRELPGVGQKPPHIMVIRNVSGVMFVWIVKETKEGNSQ